MIAKLRARLERSFVSDELAALAWDGADAVCDEAERIERAAKSPSEALVALVARFGEAGLLRLMVPKRWGGALETPSSVAICVMPLPLSRKSFTASRLNSLLNCRRGCRRFVTGHLALAAHHCLKEVSTNRGQAH